MIESFPSTTPQNLVVGQRRNRLKKKNEQKKKEGIQMYVSFNIKLLFFPHKVKNLSLTFCQNSKHFQDTLLTKLFGQFIELRNTQFFQRLEYLTWDCIVAFFPIVFWKKYWELTSASKVFIWMNVRSRNTQNY